MYLVVQYFGGRRAEGRRPRIRAEGRGRRNTNTREKIVLEILHLQYVTLVKQKIFEGCAPTTETTHFWRVGQIENLF